MSETASGMKRSDDWLTRFGLSLLLGAGAVITSLLGELFLSAFPASKTAEIASYVVAIPLLPGIAFISIFYSSWQAFHQGQIALVPVVSLPVDVFVILGIWTLIKRKSTETEKHVILHISE